MAEIAGRTARARSGLPGSASTCRRSPGEPPLGDGRTTTQRRACRAESRRDSDPRPAIRAGIAPRSHVATRSAPRYPSPRGDPIAPSDPSRHGNSVPRPRLRSNPAPRDRSRIATRSGIAPRARARDPMPARDPGLRGDPVLRGDPILRRHPIAPVVSHRPIQLRDWIPARDLFIGPHPARHIESRTPGSGRNLGDSRRRPDRVY